MVHVTRLVNTRAWHHMTYIDLCSDGNKMVMCYAVVLRLSWNDPHTYSLMFQFQAGSSNLEYFDIDDTLETEVSQLTAER
jgi:hypothetical protein